MSWVELGQSPTCLLNRWSGRLATTGDGSLMEAPKSFQACHMLVSHLTTSFASVSRTDDHGSPLWFWHTSIRFRIMTKGGLDHQKQRELGVDSSSPLCLHLCREKPSNLQFGSLHEELQPQHTPAIRDCPAGSRHCSAQHRSS